MGGCKGWDAGTRASYQNSIFSHLKSGDVGQSISRCNRTSIASSPCLQDLYTYFMETQLIPLFHFLELPELSRNPINPSRQGSNKNWIWMERREVDGCVPAHTFSLFFLFGLGRRCFMFAGGARNLVIKIIVNMIIVNRN